MCRNIKVLHNFDPPANEEEIYSASLQYVRKISGFQKPSKNNEEIFNYTVKEVARITETLLTSLVTKNAPRNREIEKSKAQKRNDQRFGYNHGI
jgi:hypothetical protein